MQCCQCHQSLDGLPGQAGEVCRVCVGNAVRASSGGYEPHSPDGDSFIAWGPDGKGWQVWFKYVRLASRRTRDEARNLIRTVKEDPALADVLTVMES